MLITKEEIIQTLEAMVVEQRLHNCTVGGENCTDNCKLQVLLITDPVFQEEWSGLIRYRAHEGINMVFGGLAANMILVGIAIAEKRTLLAMLGGK